MIRKGHLLLFCFATIISIHTFCYSQIDLYGKPFDQNLEKGMEFLEKGDFGGAEKTFSEYCATLKSTQAKVKVYTSIGEIYKSKLFYSISLSYYLKALNLSKHNKSLSTGIIYNNIGGIYYDQDNWDEALTYYQKGKSIFKKFHSKINLARSYNNIAEIQRIQKDFNPAIRNYKLSIQLHRQFNQLDVLAMNYNNIGLLYIELKEFEKAFDYLKKAQNIINKMKSFDLHASINNSFGEYYFSKSDYQNAVKFFKKTLSFNLVEEGDNLIIKKDALKGLHKSLYRLSLFKEAYIVNCEYDSIYRMIINENIQKKLSEIKHENDVKTYQSKIRYFAKIAAIERDRKRIYSFFFILSIVVLFLVLFVIIQRFKNYKQQTILKLQKSELDELELKHSKVLNEKLIQENIQLETQRKLDELSQKTLQDSLESKKRELTTSTMNTINKNEMLQSIKSTLNGLILNNDKQLKPIFKKISDEIDSCVNVDEDWGQFKMHFEQVHTDFFLVLQDKYPDLTTEELKLCGYLRINLSSKEIGQMLNITQVAINKRRNRLRKKLMIEPDVDLVNFISQIGNVQ